MEIQTDPILLQQVLFNLLINAREAMNHQGRLEIEVRRHAEGFVRLRVCDDGPGIPLAQQQQIFDLYYTTKPEGSGLGLYVARSLLARLGGTVGLDPTAPKGAAFVVTLPWLTQSPSQSLHPPPFAAEEGGPNLALPHVMLLEDEDVQTFLLTRFLRSLGLTFQAFSCGAALLEDAMALIANQERRIVYLLDITIRNGAGGLEIAPELRRRLPQEQIFLVSGYSDAWEIHGPKLGAIDIGFISKPYTLDVLRTTLLSLPAARSDDAKSSPPQS